MPICPLAVGYGLEVVEGISLNRFLFLFCLVSGLVIEVTLGEASEVAGSSGQKLGVLHFTTIILPPTSMGEGKVRWVGWCGTRNRSPQSRKLRILKHYNTYFIRPNRCGGGFGLAQLTFLRAPLVPTTPEVSPPPRSLRAHSLAVKGRSSDLVSAPWKDWTYPKS